MRVERCSEPEFSRGERLCRHERKPRRFGENTPPSPRAVERAPSQGFHFHEPPAGRFSVPVQRTLASGAGRA